METQYEDALAIARDKACLEPVRFAKFLVQWGKFRNKDWTADRSYAAEWVRRFNRKTEYLDAAGDALVSLVLVDGEEEAIKRYAKELADYNNMPMSEAIAEVKPHLARAFKSEELEVPKSFKGHSVAATKPKNDCICKSAKIMIGKLPNFDKNFKNIMK